MNCKKGKIVNTESELNRYERELLDYYYSYGLIMPYRYKPAFRISQDTHFELVRKIKTDLGLGEKYIQRNQVGRIDI